MKFRRWDVWFANVPFEDSDESKMRPVVILDGSILCLKMTSHDPRPGEYALLEWEKAGLKKQTTVRIRKVLRLEAANMKFRVGRLTAKDILAIQRMIET